MNEVMGEKNSLELDTIIAYSQMAFYILKNSASEITETNIKKEVEMLYKKFGNQEINRIAKAIMKGKK